MLAAVGPHADEPAGARTNLPVADSSRYIQAALLGRGGLAEVFRVIDARSGAALALKRLSRADRPRSRAQFEREYYTLRQLTHPSIIEVYDYGVDAEGRPFYTMELLGGHDLGELAPLPWREVCRTLLPVVSSLAVLHSRRLLHRDISARNVRLTVDGKAKLIDFGCMCEMGVPPEVVGTPPYMPPEVVHGQPLDGRADLYAFGALAYFALTGRHAFPARSPRDLMDRWRSRPTAPRKLVTDVPQPLSDLIMSLLRLDAQVRPANAAEVMVRVSGVAGLPLDESRSVRRAYLTTPKLVARADQLLSIRKQIVRARRSRGGTLLIRADPGMGRSRLLDAALLEAKLCNCVVLRGDARGEQPWTTIRGLARQLLDRLTNAIDHAPEQLSDAGLVDWLQQESFTERSSAFDGDFDARARMHELLRDWFLAVARRWCLVFAVDNFDQVDEASAGLLVALAAESRDHRLLVIATQQTGPFAGNTVALGTLTQEARSMPLSPLVLEEVEKLLASLFGDSPNLAMIAARVHAHAHGSPQIAMELAQELVDRELVRYEAGQWLLPERLDAGLLGASLVGGLKHRLRTLSARARELAECLAVGVAEALPPYSFLQLTGWADPAQVHASLSELVARQVVKREGDQVRFARPGWTALLVDGLEQERRRAIHRSIARCLVTLRADPLAVARHHFAAGAEAEGVEGIIRHLRKGSRWDTGPADYADVLKQAIAAADTLDRPHRERYRLRFELVQVGRNLGVGALRQHVAWLLDALSEASGLADWHRLPAESDPQTRLGHALSEARARYKATIEHCRTHTPGEALRELTSVVSVVAGIASNTNDVPLLRSLPSLSPFAPLSPAIAVIEQLMGAVRMTQLGNMLGSFEVYARILDEIERPDRGGLDEQTHGRIRLAMLHSVGLGDAKFGKQSALARADELAEHPAWRPGALLIRKMYFMWTGDLEAARACERELGTMQLSTGSRGAMQNAWPVSEAYCRALAGDVGGLRRCVDRIQELSNLHPFQRPFVEYFTGCLEHLRGNPKAALAAIERAGALVEPGGHYGWSLIAGSHLEILCEADPEQALWHGARYLADAERIELGTGARYLAGWFALAEARRGRLGQGFARFEQILTGMEAAGCTGVEMGSTYEIRARIALAQQDRGGFERFRDLCGANYNLRGWPALAAKYEKLVDDARALGWDAEGDAHAAAERAFGACASIRQAIGASGSASGRCQCALEILLEHHGAHRGYLFGASGAGLKLIAASTRERPETSLCELANDYLAAEVGVSSDVTMTALDLWSGGSKAWKSTAGAHYELVPVVARDDAEGADYVVGIAAMSARGTELKRPEAAIVYAVGGALLEGGDVDGISAA